MARSLRASDDRHTGPDEGRAFPVAICFTFAIGPQQLAGSKLEKNLYYCGGVSETSTPKFLEEIRAQGVGQSDVYADPMLVDLKPGDFRLKPDSPALKMGSSKSI